MNTSVAPHIIPMKAVQDTKQIFSMQHGALPRAPLDLSVDCEQSD